MIDPVISRFASVAVSTLSSAMDELGIVSSIAGLRPIIEGHPICGRALTVKEVTGELGAHSAAEFDVGGIIDAATPGKIIVIENGGAAVSTWGGVASYAAKLKGVVGTIIDGGARDVAEVRQYNYPVHCRHVVATGGRGRIKVVSIGAPISIAGVRVESDDIVRADDTGIVCVPRGRQEEVIALAERYEKNDAKSIEMLKQGRTFAEAMKQFGTI